MPAEPGVPVKGGNSQPGGRKPASAVKGRMRFGDGGAFFGPAAGIAGILLGLLFEGGSLTQILQPTAALIVFCGTFGAVAVQFPVRTVRRAALAARVLREGPGTGVQGQLAELLRLAAKMRRTGMVSLDADLPSIQEPFTRRCLTMAVDGASPREIEDVMSLENDRLEDEDEQAARAWEAAGSFAPTMGILGAVLGLIQVMQRLDDLHGVGRGIAVAFVATVYGVGSANLLFLPVAGRLRLQAAGRSRERQMVMDAVAQMAQGAGPRALRERLGAQTGTVPAAGLAEIAPR